MSKFTTLSLLSTKLFLLSCFGFMGGVSFAVSPCHETETQPEKEICEACESAHEAWSESTVLEDQTPETIFQSEYSLPDFIAAPPIHTFTHSHIRTFTNPAPPEIITKTIQLRI